MYLIIITLFLQKNITPSDFITGFHCHTYGKIEIIDENYDNGSKDENTIKNNFGAKPLHYSKIKRMNYGGYRFFYSFRCF
nr:hypothetical protein [Methanobrevibacter arboriphilus]